MKNESLKKHAFLRLFSPKIETYFFQYSVIPLIGAGISRQAKTEDAKAFPTWSELIKELYELALSERYITNIEMREIRELLKKGKHLMAAEAIKSELPTDIVETFIQKRFAPADAKPGSIHLSLFKLRCSMLMTTNYDLLLEDAFAQKYKKNAQTLTFKDASLVQRYLQSYQQWIDRPIIFKLHGSAAYPSEAVLGEIDYRDLYYRQPGYRTVLSAIFVTKVILMIGFSFADPELTILTESIRESLKHRTSPDYIVLPRNEKGSIEKKRLREDFGLQVIEYDPSPDHREIQKLIEYLASFVPPETGEATEDTAKRNKQTTRKAVAKTTKRVSNKRVSK